MNVITLDKSLINNLKFFFKNSEKEQIFVLPFKKDINKDIHNYLFKDLIIVPNEAIINSSATFININPLFIVKAIDYCKRNNYNFGLIHNHTKVFNYNIFSPQDLIVEENIKKFIFNKFNISFANMVFCNNSINMHLYLKEKQSITIHKAIIDNKLTIANDNIINL